MDAIIGDFFRRGRRLRPASQQYAENNFPRIIIRLKQRKLSIIESKILSGKRVMVLYNPQYFNQERWVILESDFLLIKEIALKTKLGVFPSLGIREQEKRIKPYVSQAFFGRGVPV